MLIYPCIFTSPVWLPLLTSCGWQLDGDRLIVGVVRPGLGGQAGQRHVGLQGKQFQLSKFQVLLDCQDRESPHLAVSIEQTGIQGLHQQPRPAVPRLE